MSEKTERELVLEAIETIKQRIIGNIDANGQRASGKSQQSLLVEDTVTGARLVSDRPPAAYAPDMGYVYFDNLERGSAPGKRGSWFYKTIAQWIIDKGISVPLVPYKTNRPHKYTEEERSLRLLAGAFATRIMQDGTQLYRQGGWDKTYSLVIQEEVGRLKGKVAINVKEQIESNIWQNK